MKALVLELPLPLSANRIWRVNPKTGRPYLNPKYRAWRKAALSHIWAQKPAGGFPYFEGKFRLEIFLPIKLRPDEDNVVKPLGDFLDKVTGIVANDRNMFGHTVVRSDEIAKGFCRVAVYDVTEAA